MAKIGDLIDRFDGVAFEELIHHLLAIRHGHAQYQKLPSEHRGEKGIEGYTFEGHAFQCYAPEREYLAADLYEKQRTKVTSDIKKFLDNESFLSSLIQPKKYSRWFLVTPEHLSADLNKHVANKTEEIKRQAPGHITDDFAIGILIPDIHLASEMAAYVNRGLAQLKLKVSIPEENEVVDWRGKNLRLIDTLVNKLKKLKSIAPEKMDARVQKYMEDFLAFKGALSDINGTAPQLYEKFIRLRDSTERTIETFSDVGAVKDGVALQEQMDSLSTKISEQFGNSLDVASVECLVRGVFADWLMRCPVDFPGESS